jgi:preprotein translocase subunit YajC
MKEINVYSLFTSTAYAMAPGADGGQGGGFTAIIPLVLMFGIFYFLLIRPQQKKAKEQQNLLNELKRDDSVVTTGGIYGKITGVTDTIITLEIAPNVRIKVTKSSIAGMASTEAKPAEDKTK